MKSRLLTFNSMKVKFSIDEERLGYEQSFRNPIFGNCDNKLLIVPIRFYA